MKKISIALTTLLVYNISSAQFAGIQLKHEQSLLEGFKPASTNTFISRHPAVLISLYDIRFRKCSSLKYSLLSNI